MVSAEWTVRTQVSNILNKLHLPAGADRCVAGFKLDCHGA
jgi:DNA-binding NarL/FixJ family response regulator